MGKSDMQVIKTKIAEGEERERRKKREKAKKDQKKFFSEFKKFITRGNVLDLAVAVVIANAFNAIVTGLVKYIITPFVTFFTSGVSIHEWKYVMKEEQLDAAGDVLQNEIAIQYGLWIQTVIDFLIIAFSIFVAVKVVNGARIRITAKEKEKEARRKQEEAEAAAKAEAEARAKAEALEKREAEFYENVKLQSKLLADIKSIMEKSDKDI